MHFKSCLIQIKYRKVYILLTSLENKVEIENKMLLLKNFELMTLTKYIKAENNRWALKNQLNYKFPIISCNLNPSFGKKI